MLFEATSIFFQCAVISPALSQSLTTTQLYDGRFACPGSEVIFTCETRGSVALAWSSDQYIGRGGEELTFTALVDTDVGIMKRSGTVNTTVATLINNTLDNGQRLLVSTLRIVVYDSNTVTCRHTSDGNVNSTSFRVVGKNIQ